MATKRAIAYTFESIRKAMEELLEDGEAKMLQYGSRRYKSESAYKRIEAQQSGVYDAAEKLGLECVCHSKEAPPECWCRKSGTGIKRGHQVLKGTRRKGRAA